MSNKLRIKINTFKSINSDRKKIFINTIAYASLQIIVIIYSIIRIFLMNIYVGGENFGLLNLMISIAPLSVIFTNASQAKSMFILFKSGINNDYENLNKKINEQIYEMKRYTLMSLISVMFLMIISYFFVKSPGLSSSSSLLLILATTIEFLSFFIVVPYVQWYLNAIYKNYIFEFFSILFATVANIIGFIIIVLFGKHIINFSNVTYLQGSTYITLIISFLLSVRIYLSNSVLLILKKKYMPWFKRIKKIKTSIFNKNSSSYLLQEFLGCIAGITIPICFYVFTTFVPQATVLSGIYYSYFTFSKMIVLISMFISSLRPFLAKVLINQNKEDLFKLNNLLFKIGGILSIWVFINFLIISPYLVLITRNYFSFIISFLIGMNMFTYSLKAIEENFICVHAKPEKYVFLTLYEIIVGIICLVVGFCMVFLIPSLEDNILNVLYCLLISEIIIRFSKLLFNVLYLNKNVYEVSFKKYFLHNWKTYAFIITIIIMMSLILIFSKLVEEQTLIFVPNTNSISIYNTQYDYFLPNVGISQISWSNLIVFAIFINVFFIIVSFLFIKITEKSFIKNLTEKIFNKNLIKK